MPITDPILSSPSFYKGSSMVAFIILSFIPLALTERSPQIVRITEDQIKHLGGTVELSCSVLYLQRDQNTVLWRKIDDDMTNSFIFKDTTPLIRDARYSMRYDSTSTTYTLQIKDIQESDAGLFRCQILMSANNYVSKDVRLMVYSPPVIYDNATKPRPVLLNEPVKLECYASGVPKPIISWKRDNMALLPTGGPVYRGSILKINSIRKEDRGTYYCSADNKVGAKVRKSFVVEVEFPPLILPGKREGSQAFNYVAEFVCRIEAFPAPIIIWQKDGAHLSSNNSRYSIYEGKALNEYTESILRIKNVQRRDYGPYFCKAVNKHGQDEVKFDLYESEDPVCPPACGPGYFSNSYTKPSSFQIVLFVLIFIRLLT